MLPSGNLRDRAKLLAFLVEASHRVGESAVDLDKLVRVVAQLTRRVVDCEIVTVLLTAGEENLLKIRHSDGLSDEVVASAKIPFGQGITGAAAEERKPVLANDVSKDSRYIRVLDSVRSEMAIPLIARGKTVGVIDLQSPVPSAFGEE